MRGEAEGSTTPQPRVFVVDDDPDVRKALGRLLRAAGLQVALFPSARDFLDAVGDGEPGCILLDHHMPGLTGRELQELLAARGAQWQIVFLTGHDHPPDVAPAMRAGAVEYLTKPAGQAEILAAVEEALARDARRRAGGTPFSR